MLNTRCKTRTTGNYNLSDQVLKTENVVIKVRHTYNVHSIGKVIVTSTLNKDGTMVFDMIHSYTVWVRKLSWRTTDISSHFNDLILYICT